MSVKNNFLNKTKEYKKKKESKELKPPQRVNAKRSMYPYTYVRGICFRIELDTYCVNWKRKEIIAQST